jgi:hypothetical protein
MIKKPALSLGVFIAIAGIMVVPSHSVVAGTGSSNCGSLVGSRFGSFSGSVSGVGSCSATSIATNANVELQFGRDKSGISGSASGSLDPSSLATSAGFGGEEGCAATFDVGVVIYSMKVSVSPCLNNSTLWIQKRVLHIRRQLTPLGFVYG